MKKQLEGRLQQLKTELASGQKVLAELEAKQTNVRDTLLRIQGAIQVIEEELAKANDHPAQNSGQPVMIQANGHTDVTTPPTIEAI
ncbi:MAG: hypothetical protein ABG776_09490 [Cyanobacteria bacterium J06555_13]